MWLYIAVSLSISPTCQHYISEVEKIWCNTVQKRLELSDKRVRIEDGIASLEVQREQAENRYSLCKNQSWRVSEKTNMEKLEDARKRLECAHKLIRSINLGLRIKNRELEDTRKSIENNYNNKPRGNAYTAEITSLSERYEIEYFKPMSENMDKNYSEYRLGIESSIEIINAFHYACKNTLNRPDFADVFREKYSAVISSIAKIFEPLITTSVAQPIECEQE